ncbi:hypothetical protein HJC23_005364 [Cyclotella cryptica]|uniref:Phytanoyl-CoA dioxygenase n=1 Tax=Cyclotella cryptica TaxID=29204 RepID=A0ABD3NRG1_9STRA|eukprot:CCRYP_020248-RA/>CCRYP_020248-RA protein AED:0.06 eAED:0.06 QI:0/-1/0/1/-1/1/1/0/446
MTTNPDPSKASTATIPFMDADNDTSTACHEQQQQPQQQQQQQQQRHEALATTFHHQGYLTLSPLLSPAFTTRLLHECSSTFHAVLHYLRQCHEIPFDTPSRPKDCGGQTCGEEFEYPMGVGVKYGYRELVMRSPGRYELALLVDNDRGGGGGDVVVGGGKRKKVLSRELLFGEDSSSNDAPTSSCATLELLFDWIHEGIGSERRENHRQDDELQQQQQEQEHTQDEPFAQDHAQIQNLLHLIHTIFSEPDTPPNTTNNKTKNEYTLLHYSLLLSTPGSQTQSWHADGGHIHLQSHAPCHCLNVFVPLVPLCPSLGPTELRPKSQYYTRDLTRMVLGAMARKEWMSPVVPLLRGGEALVFDYRILHRGGANTSHLVEMEEEEEGHGDEEEGEKKEDEVIGGNGRDGRNRGRDRPILVMTFAKSWFVDVCNFPKRSIFSFRPELSVNE